MPHIVTAKLHGEHSYTISESAFGHTVALWLTENMPRPQERLEYYMWVDARRLRGSSFTPPVRAFCVNEHLTLCLELRVKPPQDQYRWKCQLNCPNPRVANEILAWARPELFEWRAEHQRRLKAEDELLPAGTKIGNRMKKSVQKQEEIAEAITNHFGNLPYFCLDLFDMMREANREVANLEQVNAAAAQFIKSKKLELGFTVRFILPKLVERGYLNPLPHSEDYEVTELLLELADRRYRENARQKLLTLQKEERSLNGQLESARGELQRAEEKVATAKSTVETLTERLAAKQGEIAAADHPVSLFESELENNEEQGEPGPD